MDSFAHGGHDGLDGGVRDASAGKTKTKTNTKTNTKTKSDINLFIIMLIRQEQTPLCRTRTVNQLVRYILDYPTQPFGFIYKKKRRSRAIYNWSLMYSVIQFLQEVPCHPSLWALHHYRPFSCHHVF